MPATEMADSSAQAIAFFHADLCKRLRLNGALSKVRDIIWSHDALQDSVRGYFSYQKHGIHSLNHYIETRIVYPMGNADDPERDSFIAYRAFQNKGEQVPLSRVLKEIREFHKNQEDYAFRRAFTVLEDIGYNGRDQF